ncbi:MAG: zinc-dependent metalloprotease [Bacteroidota bacterium]
MDTKFRHISLCDGSTEFTMNYMDATDDQFMYHFTLGQMLRVTAMLSSGGPRGGLNQSQSLCSKSSTVDAIVPDNSSNAAPHKPVAHFQIDPNPASDQITITYPSDRAWQTFRLFNANGQLLQEFGSEAGNNFLQLDCSQHPAGIYFITATNRLEQQTQRFTLSK